MSVGWQQDAGESTSTLHGCGTPLRAQMLGMTVPKVYLDPKWLGSELDPLH
jgi:hypothetical protein